MRLRIHFADTIPRELSIRDFYSSMYHAQYADRNGETIKRWSAVLHLNLVKLHRRRGFRKIIIVG